MITINEEATQNALSPLSISDMEDQYKTDTDIFTFPSPDLWTIERNLYFLLRNSEREKFNPKYKYRPDYLALDKYGVVSLAFLLMYVNGISCIENFDLDEVVTPDISSIIDMCRDNFPKKTVARMTSVNW